MGLVLKGPPADAGDVRDVGSTPLSGRSPGVATHPSIIARGIPWADEPGGLQSMGLHSSDTAEAT